MDDLTYSGLYISLNDPNDKDLINQIAKDLKDAVGYSPTLTYMQQEQTEQVKMIIDYVFLVTIAIMMFLCFFSLSASMSANLYD